MRTVVRWVLDLVDGRLVTPLDFSKFDFWLFFGLAISEINLLYL